MSRVARKDDDVVQITSAPINRAEEQRGRQRRYLWSMSLRTVCFVGALVVGDNWVRYVLIAGALVLPYIAVVMANAVATQLPGSGPEAPDFEHRQLPGRR
ncbi:MAG: DUF3099 domain-containing protein [Marmoricola sp.]